MVVTDPLVKSCKKNKSSLIHTYKQYLSNPSPTLAMNEKMDIRSASGKNVYRLGFGGSPIPPCSSIIEAYQKHIHMTKNPHVQGLLECRQSIATFYQEKYRLMLNEDDLFIFPGSKDAIYSILSILSGSVLLPEASRVSYEPQAKMLNKKVFWIPTTSEEGYKLSSTALECFARKLDHEQKILILNSPNNPVGHVYSENELEDLARVCRSHNILVIFDGIYGHASDFDQTPYITMYHKYPEGTFFTGGMSKIFSCGGWRFGFVAIPNHDDRDKIKQSLIFKMSETISGVNTPLQYAAQKAYSMSTEILDYLNHVQVIFKLATRYVHKRLISMGLDCPKPQGGFYVFPSFLPLKKQLAKHHIFSSNDLSNLLMDHGLFFLAGTNFGVSDSCLTFRIACVDFDGPNVLDNLMRFGLKEITIDRDMSQIKSFCDCLEMLLVKYT